MALSKEAVAAQITKFGVNEHDTGNTKVQIALLTERIKQLTEHCKTFKKDTGASRALIKLVGHRRRLTKYLSRRDLEAYRALIKELGIRK
jgi:small subunit ribosomal protein S15